MQKFYETPKMEVVPCLNEDVITASAGSGTMKDGGEQKELETGIKWSELL